MAIGHDILLGYGQFFVNDVPIGLTRGGGSFVTEREPREIQADGDRGPVKGRITIDTEVPRLTVRVLEFFAKETINKFYPALDYDTLTKTVTSTLEIADTDYVEVTWKGKTKAGKAVEITVENAINMNGISWDLVDKEEVVPEIEYTGTYTEEARDKPPYKVVYPDEV